jgi:AcrR family transcriptional regulator
MSTPPLKLRDRHALTTRNLIIREARHVFGARGFADAQLSEIVTASRVTTGAIYHHFRDKKGLFLEVAKSVEAEIMEGVVRAAATKADPWEQLLAAIDAMLDICAKPDVQRIVFIDAPTVIGPSEWLAIEMQFAFGAMHQTLDALIAAGVIKFGNANALAPILLGALIEAAGVIAKAEDKVSAERDAREMVRRIFEALRA